MEIHETMEGGGSDAQSANAARRSLTGMIVRIILIELVFSLIL